MKKRIISIVLAVVMVLGMAVTMLTGVSAFSFSNEASFDAYVSENALVVDAQKDDVYNMSEQVSNAYTNYTSGTGTGFDAWTVATQNGIYVYAFVDDTTVGSEYMIYNDYRGAVNTVSNADKIQYYFQFTYSDSTNWWGYFEMDYYANNVDGETMQDNEITAAWGKTYNHVRWRQYEGSGTGISGMDTNTIPSGLQYASKILRDSNGDEYGWAAEFFIPWNVAGCVPETQEGIPATSIGVQVNNDDWSIDEGNTAFGDGWLYRRGYAYCTYTGNSYYRGPASSSFIPLNFSEESFYDYDVFLTSQHIELDGKMDDLYLNSTKAYNAAGWSGSQRDVPFSAYTVATLDGIYIFVDVEDLTMNNISNTNPADGEMVQIYIDWSPLGTAHTDPGVTFDTTATRGYNKVYGSWLGWFEADYDGNLTGSWDTPTQWLNDYGADVAVQKHANPDWDGSNTQTQYIGYSLELFLPYNDYMQYIVDTQKFSDYHFSIGYQVNDDESYDGTDARTSISYSCDKGGSYYAHWEYLPEARLVADETLARHASGASVTSATLDGVNTNGEYDGAQVIHANLAGSGDPSTGGSYRVICDGTYVSALIELPNDSTPSYTDALLGGGYRDYVDVYYARYDGSGTVWKGSYVGIGRDNTGSYYQVVDNKESGWQLEIRWELNDAEKQAFQKGEFVFAVSAQTLDGTDTGRYYKYDNIDGGVFYNGSGNTYANAFHKFVFSSDSTVAPRLDAANVALGESITMNYYATLGLNDTNAKLKVTMNDKVTYIGAQKTDVDGEYKFAFTGIAPQCMGDNITAELIVDGEVAATIADYSVLTNINNLDSDGLLDTDAAYALAADLLAYGAAAQVYAGYKTDALVNVADGWDELATPVTSIENNDRNYTDALADAKFIAAGVYHANTNKLYVKLTADDITTVSVTINGKAAVIEEYEYADGQYIVYSDDIKVSDFDEVYTFVLTNAAGDTQTLTYSVNAYASVKYTSDTAETANLAWALYAYGVSAEAYIAG